MSSDRILQFAPLLDEISSILKGHAFPVYLVGGAVRDAVLGRMSHDLDFVVETDAIQLAFSVGNRMNWPVYVLDRERDVGRVVIPEADTMLDFARFRGGDLEADLRDRDFTVNGMAILVGDVRQDQIIDPNLGLVDLEERLLRHTHAAVFSDDPIRILRLIRQALQFKMRLSPETIQLAIAAIDQIPTVSKERTRDEFFKLINSPDVDQAIILLQEWSVLPTILPEIADLSAVSQSAPHDQNVLDHTLSVLRWILLLEQLIETKKASHPLLERVRERLERFFPILEEHWARPVAGGMNGKAVLRFGALFHDVGKKDTASDVDGRIRFFNHEGVGAEIVADVCRSYALSNQFSQQTALFVAHHMRPLLLMNHPLSRRAIYRFFKATDQLGLDIAFFSLADYLATYEARIDQERSDWYHLIDIVESLYHNYEQEQKTVIAPVRLIDGQELMQQFKLKPGKKIGILLALLEEAQAVGTVSTREEAFQFIREQIQQIYDGYVP